MSDEKNTVLTHHSSLITHYSPLPMHYHLIGICGTAMASLAGMLQARGHRVTGSDENVYPPMSTMLEALGISVMLGYEPEHLRPAPRSGEHTSEIQSLAYLVCRLLLEK